MRSMKKCPARARAVVVFAGAVLAACDPGYGFGMQRQLAPAPTESCVFAALEATPGVGDITEELSADRAPRELTWRVTLADSAITKARRQAAVRVKRSSETATAVSVSYGALGFANRIPKPERTRMLELATSIVRTITSRCASGATTPIECFAHGAGTHEVCSGG